MWRPIAEMHEDYGQCVLIHVHDPGYLGIGNNLDLDFNASQWTHFMEIPLDYEEYKRMKAEYEKTL